MAAAPAPARDDADVHALAALVLAGGAAAPRRRLLQRHRHPAAALAAGPHAWRDGGLDAAQCAALREPDPANLQRTLDWLGRPGHHLLGWHDPDYPPLLRQVPSPPLALFVDGDPARLWHPSLAIVGSRTATAGGCGNARRFAEAFADAGFAVASGMAAGIDAAAHEAALARGAITVAVLGTGADVAYPRQHAFLRDRIAATGAVVSEHPPGTPPRAGHFPARNRILAGLALGTLVVEAAARSGALITARQAAEAGREVFALPGSIHNPQARGCHRLIREGAMLVETPAEVTAGTGAAATALAAALRRRLGAPMHAIEPCTGGSPHPAAPRDPEHHRLWLALDHDPTGMDSLIERTGLTAAELSSMLLVMELDGTVVVEHGRYLRKP
ncbi:DNA-processing protein DprA [Stenotrophomonas sp. MMGLT7]|uniref:DNA-processing protein DprA n=1 Tax=Stenotrophomonas sp. MMGLT7 TaxID=2901227 RepID=UPI001E28EE87|nr:DNA-processing protein DprA [Stenotrophomonas sp. MMGLT7]MCD7098391.1 DNA-processing protein DprA [Stenotrophomonas sp. MMGLT7]